MLIESLAVTLLVMGFIWLGRRRPQYSGIYPLRRCPLCGRMGGHRSDCGTQQRMEPE